MRVLLYFVLLASTQLALADTPPDESAEAAVVEKDFLILASTKSYDGSLATAQKAAKHLGFDLKLRDLQPHSTGLTFPQEVCESQGWELPCYVQRGRMDDGNWVSIEHTSSYSEFTDGYYIVVASSGPDGSEEVQSALAMAKTMFADAYVKSASVYQGCLH